MTSITVRISEQLGKEMAKIRDANWSEILRRAIEQELKRTRMQEASRTIDELKAKSKIEWDSVKVIRQWRDKRR